MAVCDMWLCWRARDVSHGHQDVRISYLLSPLIDTEGPGTIAGPRDSNHNRLQKTNHDHTLTD